MTQTNVTSRTAFRGEDANHHKFLTFCLGAEEYGLPILAVREIIGMIDVTPLPQTPAYVKGIINLRGKIIPVVELRAKFDLATVPYTAETCILVVEVADEEESAGTFQLGVIVDSVREVLDISRSDIEPPPNFGTAIPLSAILGMGKVKEKVVILLNINSIGAKQGLGRLSVEGEADGSAEGKTGSPFSESAA